MEDYLFIAVILGLLPAAIAQSKGHRFGIWWLYGSLLFPVALPHAMFLSTDPREAEREQAASGGSKKCIFCAEIIKREAVLCRFCGRDQPPNPEINLGMKTGPTTEIAEVQPQRIALFIGVTVAALLVGSGFYWFYIGSLDSHIAQKAILGEQLFEKVDLIRGAAAPELPVVEWNGGRKAGGYMGYTGDLPISIAGHLSATVDYCISGYVENRVAEATISMISERNDGLPAAKTKLKAILDRWFASAQLTLPPGLYNSITDDGRFDGESEGVTIQYGTTTCPERPLNHASTGHCTLLEVAMKPAGREWPQSEWSCHYGSRQRPRS
jgi:hypothetical protein